MADFSEAVSPDQAAEFWNRLQRFAGSNEQAMTVFRKLLDDDRTMRKLVDGVLCPGFVPIRLMRSQCQAAGGDIGFLQFMGFPDRYGVPRGAYDFYWNNPSEFHSSWKCGMRIFFSDSVYRLGGPTGEKRMMCLYWDEGLCRGSRAIEGTGAGPDDYIAVCPS